MAFPEFIELFDSGSGGLTSGDNGLQEREVTLKWLISGKAGYLDAENWASEQAPFNYQGHRRTRIDIRGLGNGWYEVAATYTNAGFPSEEGEQGDGGNQGSPNSISIDTTGGTEHVTQANTKNVVGAAVSDTGQVVYKAGAGNVDGEGALNVEGDQVRGVDVTVPQFQFTETWTFPSPYVVQTYIAVLYDLTGKINNAPWRIFDTGEVLFLGARFEMTQGASAVAITFAFSARPNVTGLSVGEIGGIEKGGWDYMGVEYSSVAEEGSIIKKPKSVSISSVYEGGDFQGLAIGNRFPGVYLPGGSFNN